MMNPRVWIDIGSGWEEVTSIVFVNDLKWTQRAFSETFSNGQNEATVTLNYSATFYSRLCALNDKGKIQIKDESGTSVFTGLFERPQSRTYDGNLLLTQITLQAYDYSSRLDVPCGDFLWLNYQVMNTADQAHSIVHQLAYKAGFNLATEVGSVNITATVAAFGPDNIDDSCLSLMNTLLYEYGYAIYFNGAGVLTPEQWQISGSPVTTMSDTVPIKSIEIATSPFQYIGCDLTYYEVGTRADSLVYYDPVMPKDSSGYLSGYPIPGTTAFLATGMTKGSYYTIVVAGTTDFMAAGAANNAPGTSFTCTAVPSSGTGTVQRATRTVTHTAPNLVKEGIYTILTQGTSDFTLVGAPNNTPGTIFIATNSTPGTGTCSIRVSSANTLYPFKNNVVDASTGVPYAINQSYLDDAIKYYTNSAVLSGLKDQANAAGVSLDLGNFTSNYTSIIGVTGAYMRAGDTYSMDAGLTFDYQYYGSKQCRWIVANPH